MSESLEQLLTRRARLLASIDAAPAEAARAQLRAEIIALFRDAELSLTELTAFRESIRELIARFKDLPATTTGAASVRHDHIGASTHIERGWSRLASAEWSDAEALFRRAIAADATSTTAPALLAWSLVAQGKRDEAMETCRAVQQREPSNPLAAVALGVAYLQAGDHDGAVDQFHVAVVGHDPKAALYGHYWLAEESLRSGRFADAVAHAERALALGPNLAEGWAVLGEGHWHLGDPGRAGQAWRTGAQARHSPHAMRCASLLETMSPGGESPRPFRP